jgi:hypothetical protein
MAGAKAATIRCMALTVRLLENDQALIAVEDGPESTKPAQLNSRPIAAGRPRWMAEGVG